MRQPTKEREIHKLKERLSIRERQCKRAEAALKAITRFESAHCSVFETEVHLLQRHAILALCEMQEIQLGKTAKALADRRQVLLGKIIANQRWGPLEARDRNLYGLLTPEGQLYGSDDD